MEEDAAEENDNFTPVEWLHFQIGAGKAVNTGAEGDATYYLGKYASAYHEAAELGTDQEKNFVLNYPPQLVVEVGETNVREDKPLLYRQRRVREVWHLENTTPNGPQVVLEAAFTNPCGDDGGVGIPASALFARLTPDILVELVEATR